MYVADISSVRVLEFDAKGSFVRRVAGKGEGPGELFALDSFHILTDGRAIAHEALRMRTPAIHYFDTQMAFKSRLAPTGEIQYIFQSIPSPDGSRHLATWLSFDLEGGKQYRHVGLVDKDFKLIEKLSHETQGMQMNRLLEPSYLMEFLGEALIKEFEPRGVGNFDASGRGYSALTTDYEVSIRSADGVLQRRVLRETKPRLNTSAQSAAMLDRIADRFRGIGRMGDMLTENFLKRTLEKTDLPAAARRIHAIVPTEDGHILVVEHLDFTTGKQFADLYDPSGKLMGNVILENWALLAPSGYPRMLFRNGFAYTVETDEEGDTYVVRYRYQFK